MKFSDTTLKNGLIQDIEGWVSLGDAGVSGNATLLAYFTNRLNRRYERALGMLGASSRLAQVDDINYENQPFSLFNIVSGQNDYQFWVDENNNSITDITAVAILKSSTATDFIELDKLTLDQTDAELIMSPNATNTGVPQSYIERNNTIFFNTLPNYSKTSGGKLFYKRVPSYFVVGDTIKQPGFNANHHQILSLGASFDWLISHSPSNQILITQIGAELKRTEDEFKVYASMRSPTRNRMSANITDCH